MTETYTFQAEIKQLLHTLIHSLYSDREIFLRELISNSSDALHRMQFEMLTNHSVLDVDAELGIWIDIDDDAGSLTIRDSGVGMTHDELVANLGTISRSGIRAFMEQLDEADDHMSAADLIGQFGVGFYSIFMVADRVEVVSRSYHPDEKAYRWISEGGETYILEEAEKADRGTIVKLFMKEDAKEFLSEGRIRQIIRKHSNYIPFPIYIGEQQAGDEPLNAVNAQRAIWRRDPNEVEDEEYGEFYKSLTLDFKDPLLNIHVRTDAPVQFYALLYIPSSAEKPVFSPRQEPGLQLYARKVLIKDYSTDLLPEYLQFVQGVVDSEDLPLNVSRETVQANRVMANLKTAITGRVLRELGRTASSEPEKYDQFWEAFGPFIKHGVLVDPENQSKLTDLLRFQTSQRDGELVSLSEYLERMKEVDGQNQIYYVIADNLSAARHSPHLEPFNERGIEVLYFTDTVDSFLINSLFEFEGYKLQNVDDEDLDLSEVGEAADIEAQEPVETDALESVVERFASVLGDRVTEVRISKVLAGKNPARLVSPEGTIDRHTQRVYSMLNQEFEVPRKILEINPRHPLTYNLADLITANDRDDLVDMTIEQIFENALLLDGLHPNPADMVSRIQTLLEQATRSE